MILFLEIFTKNEYLESMQRYWNVDGTKKLLNFVELSGCGS